MLPIALPPVKKKKKKGKPSFASTNIKGPRSSTPDINHVSPLQWEAFKQRTIRNSFVRMERNETAHARNSYLHNMSIELLVCGFHKSFEEILVLVEERKNERLKAGVDSVLWEKPTLDVETKKLDMLRQHLSNGEVGSRAGNWEKVYIARHELASYFLKCEDFKLADYFYKSALEISFKIRMDGRKKEAEALFHMGLVCERHGDVEGASKYMDECYNLSVGRRWTDAEGNTLSLSACLHLSRLFNTLAEECDNPQSAFPILQRALDVAKEGEDLLEIAQAALQLGRCYHEMHDDRNAIQYLMESFKTARSLNAEALLGRACEALSQSYYQQGELEKSLEYLRLYTDTYSSHADRHEYIKACTSLGTMHNVIGQYDHAVDRFSSAYNESNAIEEKNRLAQVLLGIARGNVVMPSYSKNLEVKEEAIMMSRIIAWKDKRADHFSDPLPIRLTSLSFRNLPSETTFRSRLFDYDRHKQQRISVPAPQYPGKEKKETIRSSVA